jgi:hypothetical protein
MTNRTPFANPLRRWSTWVTALGEATFSAGCSSLILVKSPATDLLLQLLVTALFLAGLILTFQANVTVRSLITRRPGTDPERGWLLFRIGGHLLAIDYGLLLGVAGLPADLGAAFVVGGMALLVIMWIVALRSERSRPTG